VEVVQKVVYLLLHLSISLTTYKSIDCGYQYYIAVFIDDEPLMQRQFGWFMRYLTIPYQQQVLFSVE